MINVSTPSKIFLKGSGISDAGKGSGAIRWLFVLLLFTASLLPGKAGASLVTIATGYSSYPYYAGLMQYYPFSSSESAYKPSEIGTVGNITSFALYKTSGGTTTMDSVTIYMKESSTSTATSTGSLSGYTKVYNGSFPNSSSSGWQTVTLSSAFSYTGAGNLWVMIVRRNGTTTSAYPYYWYSYDGSGGFGAAYYYSSADPWSGSPASTYQYTSPYSRVDIQLNVDPFAACTGTPAAGTAVASTTTACPGVPVTFSLSGGTMASSITYEWDTSATGTGGWALAGSTTATPGKWSFAPPTGRTLYYRCRSLCSAGGSSVTSTSVSVSVSTATAPPYTEDFESGTVGVNLPCAASTSWGTYMGGQYWWLNGSTYSYFTNHTPGGSKYIFSGYYLEIYDGKQGFWFTPGLKLNSGKTYRLSYWYISDNYTSNSPFNGAYIGTNQTAAAMTSIGPLAYGAPSTYTQYTTDFTVPADSIYYVGIRVRSTGSYGFGFDDINLIELPPCNTATSAAFAASGKAFASPNAICSLPGTVSLSISKTPAYSGLSFSWEVATGSPTSFSSAGISTASGSYSISTGGAYYFRCKVICTATGTYGYSDTTKVITTPITPPYREDFETGTAGVNMPCASYYSKYAFGSDSYWNLKTAPWASYGPGIVNHTPGGSKYLMAGYYMGSAAGSPPAYWFTPGLSFTAGKAYNVSLWFSNNGYYPSSYTSNKALLGVRAGSSQTPAAMTMVAGDDTTFNPNLGSSPTYAQLNRGFIVPTTGTYYVGIMLDWPVYSYPGFAIDDIGVDQLPSCSAKPSAGFAVASPSMICSTGSTTLSLKGVAVASDLSFQWYESNASGALVTMIPGATGLTYTTGTITTGPVYYRCVVKCSAIGAPNTDTSALVTIPVGPITPPYYETFEGATPGVNQPCAASTMGFESSTSASGHSPSYWGIKGSPSPSYAGVSNHTSGGSKYLWAGYSLSTLGGAGTSSAQQYWFSPPLMLTAEYAYKCSYWYSLGYVYSYTNNNFGLYYGTSQSASAMTAMCPDLTGQTNTSYQQIAGAFIPGTTGVYYLGVKADIQYGYYGTAIDDIAVEQLPLCSAKPAAGTITSSPSMICTTGSAKLSLLGTAWASKLKFQWQDSSASGGWANVTGGTGATSALFTTPSLSAQHWYRCIVTCPLIGGANTDTTKTYKMNVGPLDPPYMEDFEKTTAGTNPVCAGYSGGWSPSTDYYYWTVKGTPYAGYITIDNHTTGGTNYLLGGIYLGYSTGSDEYWWSPGLNLKKDSTYQMSYWYQGTGYTYGATTLGMYYGTSQTKGAMTAITTDLTKVNTSSYNQFVGRFIAPNTAVYYLGVKCRHTYGYSYYGMAIDDIGLEQLPKCSGVPTAGPVTISPSMMCTAGGKAALNMDLGKTSKVAGLSYRWEWSGDPSFAAKSSSAVLTAPAFTSPALAATTWFRCVVKCTNTGDSSFSSVVKVDVGVITPPYIETFESGTAGTNMPCAGYSIAWSSPSYWGLLASPYSATSYPAADNHTPGGSKYLLGGYYIASVTGSGDGYWFTPAIKFTGGKLYQFSFWYNGTGYAGGLSTIGAYYGSSQSPAAMTTAIAPDLVGVNTSLYTYYKAKFTPSTSGNYYIGLKVNNGATYNYIGIAFDDIGLQEVPPCSSTVVAGTITANPTHICSAGGNTNLDLDGSTLATGLTYDWYSSNTASGTYTYVGSGLPLSTPSLSANTWFKVVVSCSASGSADTSDALMVGVGGLSMPYFEDFESSLAGTKPLCSDATDWGIGYGASSGIVWSIMKSGLSPVTNHTPGGKTYLIGGYYLGYSAYAPYGYPTVTDKNFWFTPGLDLSSRYKYSLRVWYQAGTGGNVMGIFYGRSQSAGAMTNVLKPLATVSNTSYAKFDTVFKPSASGTYYLGLQKTVVPGSYAYPGVGFDDISLNYAPCDGLPFSGGITSGVSSGTGSCKGTWVQLTDTGASSPLVPGIKYQWQRRGLSGIAPTTWTNIAGAADTVLSSDTLIGYEYRLAVVCGNTGDSAFTAAFQLPPLPPHPAVTISPSVSPITFCYGDTVKFTATNFTGAVYDWMLDSVTIPGWKFNDLGATEPGTYIVKVSSALSPCPAYSEKVKLVANDPGYKVDITLPSDSILCAGDFIVLTASASKSGVTYQWRKDNIDIPGATGTTYTVSTGGAYRVVASDGTSSCPAVSRNILFTVKPNPPAVVTVPSGTLTACEDIGVRLDANLGAYTYQWTRGGSPVFGWVDSSVVVHASGVYSVKVRSADGCLSVSTDITVNILPSPVPVISRSGTYPTIRLDASAGYVSYTWMRTGASGTSVEGTGSFLTPVMKKGTYSVIVEDVNGCKGESAPLDILDEELGVGNVAVAKDIRIFPNPTQAKVFIETPVAVKVTVKDVAGKTVIEQTGGTEIDLGKYADGVYLFVISDAKTDVIIKQQRVSKSTK